MTDRPDRYCGSPYDHPAHVYMDVGEGTCPGRGPLSGHYIDRTLADLHDADRAYWANRKPYTSERTER